MSELLVKVMVLAALLELGMSLADIERCRSRHCSRRLETLSREILRIDWKPISVFPEEGRRFR